MKTIVCMLLMQVTVLVQGQSIDPVSIAAAKIIKAIDLKIQKLQNETLLLQRSQQLSENQFSQHALSRITDFERKQEALYENYFSELREVKQCISDLPQVRELFTLYASVKSLGRNISDPPVLQQAEAIMQSLQAVLKTGSTSMKDSERLLQILDLRVRMEACVEQIHAFRKASDASTQRFRMLAKDASLIKQFNQ